MNVIITILLAVAGIIALLLLISLFMKKEHYVRREIIIHAPRQKVFDYLKLLKNQDEFNKHAMAGPDRKREYKGTDGTVGYIYAWSGNKKAGEGEKEIKNLIEGERIETEIRFVKPMTATASIQSWRRNPYPIIKPSMLEQCWYFEISGKIYLFQ